MFDIRELQRAAPKWVRFFHYYEEIESTNDEARCLAEQGADHGTVVLADHQLAGRGRRGAVWLSEPGSGLLFSVVLRPSYPRRYWNRLALSSGLAVVDVLRDEWGIHAELKWPNDIYIDGKKLAGILVESQDDFAIVGIGLNVDASPDGEVATSLAEHYGQKNSYDLTREQVLASLLDGIDEEAKKCADGFGGQIARIRKYCWLTGKNVTFMSNGQSVSGRVLGVGEDGGLLVNVDGEVCSFQQAELIRVV